MNLSGQYAHAFRLNHSHQKVSDSAVTSKTYVHLTRCHASQGWYSGKVQNQPQTGSLQAPNKNSYRELDQARRESNNNTSTSSRGHSSVAHDTGSQQGAVNRVRKHPSQQQSSQVLQQPDWELIDPDLRQQKLAWIARQVLNALLVLPCIVHTLHNL